MLIILLPAPTANRNITLNSLCIKLTHFTCLITTLIYVNEIIIIIIFIRYMSVKLGL
jgi:hypothetical protein